MDLCGHSHHRGHCYSRRMRLSTAPQAARCRESLSGNSGVGAMARGTLAEGQAYLGVDATTGIVRPRHFSVVSAIAVSNACSIACANWRAMEAGERPLLTAHACERAKMASCAAGKNRPCGHNTSVWTSGPYVRSLSPTAIVLVLPTFLGAPGSLMVTSTQTGGAGKVLKSTTSMMAACTSCEPSGRTRSLESVGTTLSVSQ